MSSSQATLDAQASERKARLAKLRSLKRKEPPTDLSADEPDSKKSPSPEPTDVTIRYLSGRNYDVEARGPKLGFEHAPTEGQATLEDQAASVTKETARQQAEEEKADKPIDLFSLQPKKSNWDLKRDLERKLERLNVRTDNAIAKLVRQRIQEQQEKARSTSKVQNGTADEDRLGIDGSALVEGVHMREREEQEDEGVREESEDDEDMR